MKKLLLLSLVLTLGVAQFTQSAPKKKTNQTDSKKMKAEIDRIEKRVNEISKNIEDYKKAEQMLDELEEKHLQTVTDLKLD